ncbi:MAG: Gfo/Idh/MocA family oxidoreductase, partial [Acidimicrobiales bacterium]
PASTSGGYPATMAAFAESVEAGTEPNPSGVDGLRSVQLTTAIATAAQSGGIVRLSGS